MFGFGFCLFDFVCFVLVGFVVVDFDLVNSATFIKIGMDLLLDWN